MPPAQLLSYLLLGVGAGFCAGLFGIGGGLVIVPALVYLFQSQLPGDHLMQTAIGTSLATIIPTALASTWAHHRHGAVAWALVRRLAPGIVAGTAVGAVIADLIGSNALRSFFAVFLFAVALHMALGALPSGHRLLPGRVGMIVTGIVIGMVSALVGIGGGTLTTPFLAWCRVELRRAVATSAACGLPIALTGTISYLIAGLNESGPPAGSGGYIHWPAAAAIAATSIFTAPLGARLTHVLPVPLLRRLFAVLLAAAAARLLWY